MLSKLPVAEQTRAEPSRDYSRVSHLSMGLLHKLQGLHLHVNIDSSHTNSSSFYVAFA